MVDLFYIHIWNRTMKPFAFVLSKGKGMTERDGEGEPNEATV
jgi:hypothetical protein